MSGATGQHRPRRDGPAGADTAARRPPSGTIAGLLVAAALGSPAAPAAAQAPDAGPAPAPAVRVSYDGARGTLSVTAAGAPLALVLDAIAREAPVEIEDPGAAASAEPVSDRFDELPLPRAIARLLAGRSYVLAPTAPGGREYRLWLMTTDTPGGSAGAVPAVRRLPPTRRARAAAPPSATDGTGLDPEAIEELLQRSLAEALRTGEIPAGEGLPPEVRTLLEQARQGTLPDPDALRRALAGERAR